jgi:hypothetical protein
MGTWISSFFDNEIELAADVRNEYVDYLEAGETGRQATRQVIEGFSEELCNAEQCPVVWMALAVTQWKYGRLEPRVKAKALKAIKSGGDLASYPEDRQTRRQRVLENVRVHLESPQPAEKKVRVVKSTSPNKKNDQIWTVGQVVAFRRASGRYVMLLTEFVEKNPYRGQIPTFVLLKWHGRKVPPSERIRSLSITECVISLYPNKRGDAVPWDRVERLEATREPSGLVHSLGGGVYCPTGFEGCQWNELESKLP